MQIKPILKSKRNTVILHDLPEAIAEEELRRKLFIDSSTGITDPCRQSQYVSCCKTCDDVLLLLHGPSRRCGSKLLSGRVLCVEDVQHPRKHSRQLRHVDDECLDRTSDTDSWSVTCRCAGPCHSTATLRLCGFYCQTVSSA